MKNLFLILSIVLLFNVKALAQKEYALDVAAGPVYAQEIARTNKFTSPTVASNLYGFQASFKIKGAEEGYSELNIIPGFWRQKFNMKQGANRFDLFSNTWNLQTEIVLRKPERNINPILGIGIGRTAIGGMRWLINNKAYDWQREPDSLFTSIKDMDRRAHPFISFGINGIFKVGIRQLDISLKGLFPLQNYFSEPNKINPWAAKGGVGSDLSLNIQPTYLLFSVNYYYSRLANWTGKRN